MQKVLICLTFFTCICVSICAANSVKGGHRSRCRINRQYQQIRWTNFSQNPLCYKTMPYSHVLTLNTSGSLYNIISQSSVDSQPNNDSWVTILDCCDGYKRNVTNNICMPVCTYECQENAHCISPEICACKSGYKEMNGQCIPICKGEFISGCRNGECIAPNLCRCEPGTENILNVCMGTCERDCSYGTCVADVCTCHEYHNISNDHWNCPLHCQNPECSGECPALSACECQPGSAIDKNGQCVSHIDYPQCQYGCGPNGRCVGPNLCECDPGFRNDRNTNRCVRDDGNIDAPETMCQLLCLNGYCTGPDECTCNQGYIHNTDDPTKCVPVCEGGCANGVCTLPNVCICNFGSKEENGRKMCASQT